MGWVHDEMGRDFREVLADLGTSFEWEGMAIPASISYGELTTDVEGMGGFEDDASITIVTGEDYFSGRIPDAGDAILVGEVTYFVSSEPVRPPGVKLLSFKAERPDGARATSYDYERGRR